MRAIRRRGVFNEEVMKIFQAATEPFQTYLWVLGESGMRPAEVCAVDARYIHLDDRVISVRQSESLGHVVKPKTSAGHRDFAISPQLADHLRVFLGDKKEGFLLCHEQDARGVNPKWSRSD
jgi:integrase